MRFEGLHPSESGIPRTEEEKLAHISRFVAHFSGEIDENQPSPEISETVSEDQTDAAVISAA